MYKKERNPKISESSEDCAEARSFKTAPNQNIRSFNQAINLNPRIKSVPNKKATSSHKLNQFDVNPIASHIKLLFDKLLIENIGAKVINTNEYKEIIQKCLKDTNKIKAGELLLMTVAQCENLMIIIDGDHDSINFTNAREESSSSSKRISKSLKLLNRKPNEEIKCELAHELCHYAMNLVYENYGNPYYKHCHEMKTKFDDIINKINKFTSGGAESDKQDDLVDDADAANVDDELSSVFRHYKEEDFHAELIVRVVQLMILYDDNEDKCKFLQEKYQTLFDFWRDFVAPDLVKFNLKHRKIVREFNQKLKILSEISYDSLNLRESKNLEEFFNNKKLLIVTTNVPKLLLINIYQHLHKKYVNLCDAENIFITSKLLNDLKVAKDFKRLLETVPCLTSIIDCTNEVLSDFNLNRQSNLTFIVSNENDSIILLNKLGNLKDKTFFMDSKMKNLQAKSILMTINYTWTDLTIEYQKQLLQTKINFQNNINVPLFETLSDSKDLEAFEVDKKEDETRFEDFKEVIGCELLKFLTQNNQISINAEFKTQEDDENFNFLYQKRKFIKKRIEQENDNEQIQNSSQFEEMTEDQMLLDIKDRKLVIISDVAGNGKTWAMKNILNILRDKMLNRWITYVDLKQYIDDFKNQVGDLEFSTFIVDKVLRTKFNFEKETFKYLYKYGKVCVFFDGLNEIPAEHTAIVVKLIRTFKLNGGNQLWIATREYLEDILVSKLNIDVTYKLKTLTVDDGCDLIAKSWMLEDKKGFKVDDAVEFEDGVMKKVKDSQNYKDNRSRAYEIIRSDINVDSRFIGLPLLFKMIAKICINQRSLANFKDLNHKEMQIANSYREFILIFYERWTWSRGQLRSKESTSRTTNDLNFWTVHQYLAMIYLFPNYIKFFEALDILDEEILACGLVIKVNNQFYFIHETFAEFFAANFISKMLLGGNINENLIAEVLLNQKFNIVRVFLDDLLKESTITNQRSSSFSEKLLEALSLRQSTETSKLNEVADAMVKLMDKFYEMGNFTEFFINNLEVLTDLIVFILRKGEYGKVIKLLNSNSSKIIKNSNSLRQFNKFLNFLLEFTKISDLKEIIKENQLFIEVIQSNLDHFEDFVLKIYQKTDKNFIRENLKLKSNNSSEDNIIGCLCWSNNQNIEKFIQILQKYLNNQEILELMQNCNKNGENVLHICVQRQDKELLRTFWMIIENLNRNIEEFITKTTKSQGSNILHFSAFCRKINFHENLWELLFQTFKDRDKLRDLINQKDNDGYNFIHLLIKFNKPEVLEFIIMVLKENFNDFEYQNIIKSQDLFKRNLLQHAAANSKDLKIHQILWKILRDSCKSNEEFMKFVTDMDKNSNKLFHTAVCFTNSEIFEFMIHELEKITSKKKIRNVLKSSGMSDRNLLQLAACHNTSIEFHQYLWHLFFDYFSQPEMVKIIKLTDDHGYNLFHLAVLYNSKEILELTWKKVSEFIIIDDQIEYLKSKNVNILKLATENRENPEVVDFVSYILQEYAIDADFQEASQTENLLSLEKSEEENSLDLIEAVKKNGIKTIKELLKSNHDIDFEDNHRKNAIDYAWINFIEAKTKNSRDETEKIILELLNANSQFPKRKFKFEFEKASEKIQIFINMCESMHRAVEHHDINHLNKIIEEYPNLRFFYDRNNESVLLYSLKRQRIDALEVILGKLSIRHDESLSEIFYEFSNPDLEDMIISSRSKLPQPQILLLIAKSKLKYATNPQKCWSAIYDAFLILNEVDSCSTILKITSIWKQLRINFDFSKEKFSNFIPPGTVNIGAKDMEITTKFEVIGSVAHELNHLAIQIAFMNNLNPFPMGESTAKLRFIQICKNIEEVCRENPGCEVIVKCVFNSYDKISQPSELIVRPMQIVMHYYESAAKINKNQRIFNELFNYHEEVVLPELEKTIPVLKMLQKNSYGIEFSDLTESMKAKVLHSKILFQGVETTFFNIIGDDCKAQESILEHLSSENIHQILLNDKAIEIVSNIEVGQERYIIDRNYVRISKDNQADNDKNEELTLKLIADGVKNSKIFILAETAGAGKSTTFRRITTQLKDLYKSSCVSLIELKDHKDKFNSYKDSLELERILIGILNPKEKIEAVLFKHLLKNGKLILLFDGFDEVSPNYSQFVVKMSQKLTSELKNQVWISTRPHFSKDLESMLGVESFKFSSLKLDQKSKLINSILNKPLEFELFNDLKAVFDFIEKRSSSTSFNIDNILLIESIVKVYMENEQIFKPETLNLYEIIDKVLEKLKEKLCIKIPFNDNFLRSRFQTEDIHKVYALKKIIGGQNSSLDELVEDMAITKNWKRESKKWEVDKIQRYGILTSNSNNIEDSVFFVHRIYAEFYLVQYLISYIFEMNFGIRFEEYEKIFTILRFITESGDDFEVIKRLLLDFLITNSENQEQQLDENMKLIIIKNIPNTREKIVESENYLNLMEFWSTLFRIDKEIFLKFFQVNEKNNILEIFISNKNISTENVRKINDIILSSFGA